MLFFLKVCAASAAVGWVCHDLVLYLQPRIAWHKFTGDLLLISVVTSVGVLLLLALAKLLRIRELDQQVERLWILAASNWSRITKPRPSGNANLPIERFLPLTV